MTDQQRFFKSKKFTEKGFGNDSYGKATILATTEGKPLSLQTVIFPDGKLGGQFCQFRQGQYQGKPRSFCSEGPIVQLILERTGSVGTVNLVEWCNKEIMFSGTAGIIVLTDGYKVTFDNTMDNGSRVSDLLITVFADALNAAVRRSYTEDPNGLYFGNFAKDAKPVTREALTPEVIELRKQSK